MVLAGEWEGVKDLKKGFLMFKKEEGLCLVVGMEEKRNRKEN